MVSSLRPLQWGHLKSNHITFKTMSDENKYTLTRSEYAKKLDISVDTLKKRMRRGLHKEAYIFKDGRYFFCRDTEVRPNMVNSPVTDVPTKRVRNRGNHINGKYPNSAFQQHNEMKMLAKLKHKVDLETQELLPQAIQIAKQKKQQRIVKSLEPTKNYGGLVVNRSPMVDVKTDWKPLFETPKDEYEKYIENNDLKKNTKSYY